MNEVFQQYIADFAKFEPALAAIIKYTTEMDLLQCKAYTAHKYNYCKPHLATPSGDKSFFEFTGIRHPLIEHIQTNELYVTNDMALGANAQESNGILLYGTNDTRAWHFYYNGTGRIICTLLDFYLSALSQYIYAYFR